MSDPEVVPATTAAQWRAWLEDHGSTATEAWVVLPHQGSGRAGLTHRLALEEALCFGWIDGLNQRHDESARRQRFSPRRATSVWSAVNKDLVAELIAAGRMTPAGQATIDVAKRNGQWTLFDDAHAGVVPEDLRAALDAEADTARGWAAMTDSQRRMALERLTLAKRPETRSRRIAEALDRAREKS